MSVAQIYNVGTQVYTLCTIADAISSDTDVEYTMKTYRGKFRVSQVNDTLKRTPDAMKDEITTEVTAEVQANDLDYFKNFVAMTTEQITACFGSTYTTLAGVLASGKTMAELITAYNTWNDSTSIVLGDVVKITASNLVTVVIKIWTANDTINYSLLDTETMTTTSVKFSDNAITDTNNNIDITDKSLTEIKAAVDALNL